MAAPSAPVDVVYTWVDGSWPGYLDLVRPHARTPRDCNPERFRDSFELLRYSLRSLLRFAPWIRRIYLFTCRPQVPAWLDAAHPRLRIVHHDDVVAEPGVLPMFNSNVIETYLHRLPGLSPHFLYFNDDYFLGAPAGPEAFYTPDGRLRVFGTVCGERLRGRVYEKQLVGLGLLEHGPVLIDAAEWERAQTGAADEIRALRRHRFRQPNDLRIDRLYRWHLLTHCRDRAVAEPCWRYLPQAKFLKLTPHPARIARALADLERSPRRFICFNDDLGPEPHPGVVAAVRAYLARTFPAPAPWEIAAPGPATR